MKQRYAFRILSVLLALILVFELFPIGALARDTRASETEAATVHETAEGEPSGKVIGEVTEYRDQREKHFRMEDGSFIAVDYGVPVHYALDEETWADIDNTLIPQSSSASTASVIATQPTQNLQQYTAVNGDDTKTFAGSLATGFLFSAQRGQAGVQMSLLDGGTAPTEPEMTEPAETVLEEAESEKATEPATEPDAPTEALPVTEPDETLPVTEPTEDMTESTEETTAETQAEGSAQPPVEANGMESAEVSSGSSTQTAASQGAPVPEAAEEALLSELQEPLPEIIPETAPETEPETILDTEP